MSDRTPLGDLSPATKKALEDYYASAQFDDEPAGCLHGIPWDEDCWYCDEEDELYGY
jgi:hypothetical protein